MYLIITRSFPPEIGGMQNLMWGLTCSLAKFNLVKVFADFHDQHKLHDSKVSFSIERVGGIKILRKYRKSYLINEFIKDNKNIECIIAETIFLCPKTIFRGKGDIFSRILANVPIISISAQILSTPIISRSD